MHWVCSPGVDARKQPVPLRNCLAVGLFGLSVAGEIHQREQLQAAFAQAL